MEITAPIPASVAAGLVRARRAVRPVEKDSKNTHHGYKYASADDVAAEGLRALNEGGLAFLTLSWVLVSIDRPRVIAAEDGSVQSVPDTATRLRCVHALVAEDGASVEITTDLPVLPDRGRPEDKAALGALTESYAYAIRGLLGIPRVDESISVSGRDDTPPARKAPLAARPLAPPAADPAPAPAASTAAPTYESNLARQLRQAQDPAGLEAAFGAMKTALSAGQIDRDAMSRLFDQYKARKGELTAPPVAGAAQ